MWKTWVVGVEWWGDFHEEESEGLLPVLHCQTVRQPVRCSLYALGAPESMRRWGTCVCVCLRLLDSLRPSGGAARVVERWARHRVSRMAALKQGRLAGRRTGNLQSGRHPANFRQYVLRLLDVTWHGPMAYLKVELLGSNSIPAILLLRRNSAVLSRAKRSLKLYSERSRLWHAAYYGAGRRIQSPIDSAVCPAMSTPGSSGAMIDNIMADI